MNQLTDEHHPQHRRLIELRNSLGIEIIKIEPAPGDLLVVRPKDESVRFSKNYCDWLMEVLNDYLQTKNNVKVILLAENDTSLLVASPPESGEEYRRGWHDALEKIRNG